MVTKISRVAGTSRIPTAISLRCDERILSPHMQSFLSNVHSACIGSSSNMLPIGRRTDFYAQFVKRRRFAQGCAFWGSQKQKLSHFFSGNPHFCHPHLITSFPHKYINFAHYIMQKSHFCQKCCVTQNKLMPKCVFGWGSAPTPMGKLTTLS